MLLPTTPTYTNKLFQQEYGICRESFLFYLHSPLNNSFTLYPTVHTQSSHSYRLLLTCLYWSSNTDTPFAVHSITLNEDCFIGDPPLPQDPFTIQMTESNRNIACIADPFSLFLSILLSPTPYTEHSTRIHPHPRGRSMLSLSHSSPPQQLCTSHIILTDSTQSLTL